MHLKSEEECGQTNCLPFLLWLPLLQLNEIEMETIHGKVKQKSFHVKYFFYNLSRIAGSFIQLETIRSQLLCVRRTLFAHESV